MAVKKTAKDAHIIWQEVPDNVGEPALLIETYSDCITITQEGRSINVGLETIPELIKLLKTLKP